MKVFDINEILQFAINIEENGEYFYRNAAAKLNDKETKSIFTWLANEEITHKNLFKEMLSKLAKYEPPEAYSDEYFAYLKGYTETIIFPKEEMDKRIAKISDALPAVNFAIERELESVLYYQEMKNFVPENQYDIIDKIVEEERQHFVKLVRLKKALM